MSGENQHSRDGMRCFPSRVFTSGVAIACGGEGLPASKALPNRSTKGGELCHGERHTTSEYSAKHARRSAVSQQWTVRGIPQLHAAVALGTCNACVATHALHVPHARPERLATHASFAVIAPRFSCSQQSSIRR